MPDDNIPDFYSDQFSMLMNNYGVTFSFWAMSPFLEPGDALGGEQQGQQAIELKGVVRMSLEHAKAVAIVLKKNLKQYEESNQTIYLPPGVYERLGVPSEEW